MKLLIQKTNETKDNIKKIELTSSDFENNTNTYIIKENESPIIYLTDTESNYFIDDINSKLERINSETIAIITMDDLISLGGGSGSTENIVYRVTRAEAVVLQETASFIVGATYVITDADVNLYGGTEITLTAITESELSLQGSGKFYCPKYDLSAESTGYGIWTKYMEGTFSNIVGTFVPNEIVTANNGATAIYLAEGFLEWISGEWASAVSVEGVTGRADISGFVTPSYRVDQIVHWGGKSWTNVNGNIGASIDKYTLDAEWKEIPFNETDYNVYIDEIHYDFGNDMIIYRKDRYNNVVRGNNQVFVEFESPNGYGYENPIKDFQWGCAQDNFNTDDYFSLGIQGNEVIDSYFETLNTRGKYIWNNKLSQFSNVSNNTLSSNSSIQKNTLSSNSSFSSNTLSSNSSFSSNTLSNSSKFSFSNSVNVTRCNANSFNVSNSIIDLNGATIISSSYSKELFDRQDGTPRLQYVNNSDVVVITDVNV